MIDFVIGAILGFILGWCIRVKICEMNEYSHQSNAEYWKNRCQELMLTQKIMSQNYSKQTIKDLINNLN